MSRVHTLIRKLDTKLNLGIACVLVAIAFRTAVLIAALPTLQQPGFLFGGDAHDYHHRAICLLQYHTYGVSDELPQMPDSKRPPGYPFIIALIYAITGPNPIAVAVFQIAVAGALTAVLFAFTSLYVGHRLAGLVAILFALEPLNAIYTLALMTEAISALFIMVVVWLLVSGLRSGRAGTFALAGVVFGLSILVRPASIALLPMLAILCFWYLRNRAHSVHTAGYLVLIFLVVSALPAAAWTARNWAVFGVAKLSSVTGIQLYYGNAADLLAHTEGVEATQEYDTILADRILAPEGMHASYQSMRQFEASDKLAKAAYEVFRQHPALTVRLTVSAFFAMLTQPNRKAYEVFPEGSPFRKLWPLNWLIWNMVVLLTVLAICFNRRYAPDVKELVLLLVAIIFVTTIVCGIVASSRYRITIEPLFYVLAALGLHVWRHPRDTEPSTSARIDKAA